MIIIVCGVSGTGKTTIGKLLADNLELPFYDADTYHPASNVEKMAAGIALDDDDRQPWLNALADNLADWQGDGGAVLACSALKESYRATLRSSCDENLRWVVLHGSEATLTRRLESRAGHFFDRQLLVSQLNTLELPDYGWRFDVDAPAMDIVKEILEKLGDVRAQ